MSCKPQSTNGGDVMGMAQQLLSIIVSNAAHGNQAAATQPTTGMAPQISFDASFPAEFSSGGTRANMMCLHCTSFITQIPELPSSSRKQTFTRTEIPAGG